MNRRNFLKTLLAVPAAAIVGVNSIKQENPTGLDLGYYQEPAIKVTPQWRVDGGAWQPFEINDTQKFEPMSEENQMITSESIIETRISNTYIMTFQDTTIPT